MGIYLYVVEPGLLEKACRVYVELTHDVDHNWVVRDIDAFNEAMGLVEENYIEYDRTGKLRVNAVTLKKLELLASGKITHWRTLFKMIEVKYGTKAETDGDGEHGGSD